MDIQNSFKNMLKIITDILYWSLNNIYSNLLTIYVGWKSLANDMKYDMKFIYAMYLQII